MVDVGMIIKLLKNPSDLPAAAKALGLEHTAIMAPDPLAPENVNAARRALLQSAFVRLATAAQLGGAEIIELAGAPALMKGKRIRILAVLEDPGAGRVASDAVQTAGVAG